MAGSSGDQILVEWRKRDPHDEALKIMVASHTTAEEVDIMKVEDSDRYKRLRVAAKMINFGIPYGRSAANLAPQLNVTVPEARKFIKDYWLRLPKLKIWADAQGPQLIANDQEHVSIYGNKRRFPLITDNQHRLEIHRLAVHFPIMSSVNYLSATAHFEVVDALRAAGIDTKVYPHIHDSINVCVPDEEVTRAAQIIADVMADVPRKKGLTLLPFGVEFAAGFRWGDQRTVYDNGALVDDAVIA